MESARMGFWQKFIETPHLGDYLSLVGLALTIFGFGFTLYATFRAKRAAEAAKDAAEMATREVRKIDLVSEIATVIQLIEELKRLHRARASELLPDRYSGLRLKLVAVRESKLLSDEADQVLMQDVVARLAALEKAIDKNSSLMDDKRQVARSNESLSICSESIMRLNERIKAKVAVIL